MTNDYWGTAQTGIISQKCNQAAMNSRPNISILVWALRRYLFFIISFHSYRSSRSPTIYKLHTGYPNLALTYQATSQPPYIESPTYVLEFCTPSPPPTSCVSTPRLFTYLISTPVGTSASSSSTSAASVTSEESSKSSSLCCVLTSLDRFAL